MTSINRSGRVSRLAMLPVLFLVTLLALLPADAGASSGHYRGSHAAYVMHHDPAAADERNAQAGAVDCAGSFLFCWMTSMCHPALSPNMLVMPVGSNLNDPTAPEIVTGSGRHPSIPIPPPRRLFV
jgi:hypothetical protein